MLVAGATAARRRFATPVGDPNAEAPPGRAALPKVRPDVAVRLLVARGEAAREEAHAREGDAGEQQPDDVEAGERQRVLARGVGLRRRGRRGGRRRYGR